jgi:hypothetical protein
MRRRSVLALIAGAAVPALGLAWHSRPTAGFQWRNDHPDFGGISALHLWPDALRFLALTDRGRFIEGRLRRDALGAITDAQVSRIGRLLGPEGRTLRARETDSEGIALGPDGAVYVSFEGPGGGRVWRYDTIDGPATALPRPDAFRQMRLNSSLEALAIDRNGHLFTLPEDKRLSAFPLWRYDGTWSKVADVPRRGDYLPVAADFGPDGALYLLERRFLPPLGFLSRLSRVGPGAWDQPETLWGSTVRQHDNLEGLSMTVAGNRLRATMVSDDNFLRLQSTELVEVLIDPA